ncbi:unnamed protein product [Prorocentrum cordatum]|uniref:Uncharacterized protein n=1 Tax=Prorocentrum cordatum TaxID=2364126 RepID=A0ABN9RG47_9DINO|nr:unnamed protein product [Polarella glacialis]
MPAKAVKREQKGAASAPPPMKRAKAKAKQPGSDPAGSAGGAQPEAPPETNQVVGPTLDIITDALNAIKGSPFFADLEKKMPLTIAQGGRQAPFVKEDCSDALSRGSPYSCGCNLFWQNFFWSSSYRTPVNMGQVREIVNYHLKSPPNVFPMNTVFAVDSSDMDVTKHLGSLQRLSPIEPQLALLMAIADAVKQQAEDSILSKWMQVVLSAPVTFEVVLPGDMRYWRAQNIRQEWIEHGETAQLTVRQWVYDIVGFKAAKEKELEKTLGAKDVSELYEKKMKYARSTEKVKPTFVDNAITVHKRLLSLEASNRCLVWADENLMNKSPWNSLYAMHAVVERASTPNKIDWAMMGLTDHYRMDFINLGEFGVSKLRDYRQSYVEILNMKYDVKNELLFKWLPRTGIPTEHVTLMQEKMNTFDAVRTYVSSYPGGVVDTTWQALISVGGKQSAVSAVTLIEELVYTTEFDSRYRNAVQSKLEAADFLAYESISTRMNEVIEMVRRENNGGHGTTDTPAAAGSGTGTPAAAGLPEMDKTSWNKFIDKLIRTYVQIVPDQKTAAELETMLRDSALATIKGDPTGLVLYHFDVKQFGEPLTRPELRIAPLRDGPYHRLVRTMLNARAPQGQLAHLRNGEVAVILDGGRRGNATKLLGPWKENTIETKKDTPPSKGRGCDEPDDDDDKEDDDNSDAEKKAGFKASIIQLAYTEESLKKRRNRVHGGTGSLQQVEWVHMLAHSRISVPERRRKHFEGSTAGDLINGIELPELSKEWHVTWKDKKAIYGKRNLIAVGGKTEGIQGEAERKTDSTVVPISYHGMPLLFYKELLHMFFVKCVLDMTPLNAKFAWACLEERVAYVGVAFTKEHMEKIYLHLAELVKSAMADPGSKLFNKEYAKAVGKEVAPTPKVQPGPTPARGRAAAAMVVTSRRAAAAVAVVARAAALPEEMMGSTTIPRQKGCLALTRSSGTLCRRIRAEVQSTCEDESCDHDD